MDGIGEESGARVYTAGHNSFLKAMQSGCYSPSHGSGSLIIEAPFLFKPKPRFADEKKFQPRGCSFVIGTCANWQLPFR